MICMIKKEQRITGKRKKRYMNIIIGKIIHIIHTIHKKKVLAGAGRPRWKVDGVKGAGV